MTSQETHLISLPHVAVEDSSHALDGGMLQLVGSSHVIIYAPAAQGGEGQTDIKRQASVRPRCTLSLR